MSSGIEFPPKLVREGDFVPSRSEKNVVQVFVDFLSSLEINHLSAAAAGAGTREVSQPPVGPVVIVGGFNTEKESHHTSL